MTTQQDEITALRELLREKTRREQELEAQLRDERNKCSSCEHREFHQRLKTGGRSNG